MLDKSSKYQPKVSRICELCGAPFFTWPYMVRNGTGRFCGLSCRSKARTKDVADRFWAKVDKNGPPHPYAPSLGSCWLWTGSLNNKGYGRINISGKSRYAHRVAWSLTNDQPLADDRLGCHTCDRQNCVRPTHLFDGSPEDNQLDAAQEGRLFHKLSPDRVRLIRQRCADGVPRRAVAREFGITPRTVADILERVIWAHV